MKHPQAHISFVENESPADDAGFSAGCSITAVDGMPIRDLIDWRWYTAGDQIEVSYIDTDGDQGNCVLSREEGQDWGFEFSDIIFDEPMTCMNRCTFCFMRQLPEESRKSLRLRDDDYRMSFLQGNFVTFTNLEQNDVERILEQRISPLRFSLHAVDPKLREDIIGPRAQRGLDVAEQLLSGGIELHAQIVLMPHVNDGEALKETLTWAYEHPGIINVAIVPLGYTSHQDVFTESFQSIDAAQGVLKTVQPFQKRACKERGFGWAYPSDEFYRNAFPFDLLEQLPEASFYGDFGMFEDGIGIIRSYVDDWNASLNAQHALCRSLVASGQRALLVCGCAQREFLDPLLDASPLHNLLVPLYVKNEYFGGNVDVTGLLVGCDIARAVQSCIQNESYAAVCIPEVVFNADNVTLDDMTVEQISQQAGCAVYVVSCEASKFIPQIQEICETGGAPFQNIS